VTEATQGEGVRGEVRAPAGGRGGAYRGDIDGLRAVAVLLVVFDHLKTRVTGGYIGVDVFFVISGYLISSHVLAEMAARRFSIVRFYEKRVRRIFPALLCMMAVVSVVAWREMLPSQLAAYARTLLAAILSVSNMVFWRQEGYFEAQSAVKPLLHTWSLAVEEQFYVFFPVFLLVVRRWMPKRLQAAIWTVAAVSFGLALWAVRRDAAMAFFFAPLRAWELLLGTIASQHYLPEFTRIRGAVARNVCAAAGLLLILVPGAMYSASTVFPGLAAVPPCVGAVLIIMAGETGGSGVGRLLAWRPVAFVGLISYSLYLWHWPVLVFQRTSHLLTDEQAESKAAKAAVLVVSLVLGTLSWWLVERPFRQGKLRPGRRLLFALNGAAVVLLLAVGMGIVLAKGVPSRFTPDELKIANYEGYKPGAAWRTGSCFLLPADDMAALKGESCVPRNGSGGGYLLMGDSLAAQLYPGLAQVFPGDRIAQATAASCRPLVTGGVTFGPVFDAHCKELTEFLYGDYLEHRRGTTVLLAAAWEQTDLRGLSRTLAWMHKHGIRVVLFGPSVEYDESFPHLLVMALRSHKAEVLDRHRVAAAAELDAQMRGLARDQWQVPYVSFSGRLCGTGAGRSGVWPEPVSGCLAYGAPGVPLVFDNHHLTVEGSVLLARLLKATGTLQ
jgi:peptidoglycan/LPS O-acetylase OafA/YrhL